MVDLFNAHVTGIRVRKADGTEASYKGRPAWMLKALIDAGHHGCTSIDVSGPRVSHYIFCLRRAGLNIETESEAHSGPFAGSHARYRLKTPLQVISTEHGSRKPTRRAA